MPLADIAIGTREQVSGYGAADKFLVVTGDKVSTVYTPEASEVSELQLDMGIKLPLSRPKELQNNLYGQNPCLSHMVLLLGQSSKGAYSQPFVIHDVHGLGYMQEDGTLYKGTLNGVSVPPMLTLQSNKERTYLDSASIIKTMK